MGEIQRRADLVELEHRGLQRVPLALRQPLVEQRHQREHRALELGRDRLRRPRHLDRRGEADAELLERGEVQEQAVRADVVGDVAAHQERELGGRPPAERLAADKDARLLDRHRRDRDRRVLAEVDRRRGDPEAPARPREQAHHARRVPLRVGARGGIDVRDLLLPRVLGEPRADRRVGDRREDLLEGAIAIGRAQEIPAARAQPARGLHEARGPVLLEDEALPRLGRAQVNGNARRGPGLVDAPELLEGVEQVVKHLDVARIEHRRGLEVRGRALEPAGAPRERRGAEPPRDVVRPLDHRALERLQRGARILEVIAEEHAEAAAQFPGDVAPDARVGDALRPVEHAAVRELELAPLLPRREEDRDQRERIEERGVGVQRALEQLDPVLLARDLGQGRAGLALHRGARELQERDRPLPRVREELGVTAARVERRREIARRLVEPAQAAQDGGVVGADLPRPLEELLRSRRIPGDDLPALGEAHEEPEAIGVPLDAREQPLLRGAQPREVLLGEVELDQRLERGPVLGRERQRLLEALDRLAVPLLAPPRLGDAQVHLRARVPLRDPDERQRLLVRRERPVEVRRGGERVAGREVLRDRVVRRGRGRGGGAPFARGPEPRSLGPGRAPVGRAAARDEHRERPPPARPREARDGAGEAGVPLDAAEDLLGGEASIRVGLVEVLDEGAGEHRGQVGVERADRVGRHEELDARHGGRRRLLRGGDDGARGRPGAVVALEDEEHLAPRAIAEHRGHVAQRVAHAGVLGVEAEEELPVRRQRDRAGGVEQKQGRGLVARGVLRVDQGLPRRRELVEHRVELLREIPPGIDVDHPEAGVLQREAGPDEIPVQRAGRRPLVAVQAGRGDDRQAHQGAPSSLRTRMQASNLPRAAPEAKKVAIRHATPTQREVPRTRHHSGRVHA
ncbi:hypothetical protein SOCE836_058700 [Sorangium cellulosum]|uniref:Uncharacterized protein n=1 Tax=Sorangium cellulosum TaxID=56 RepID=A0A4P2QU73_SORCE|nr:hypothetical protein SOCE836_058700 [Sorangium cellulosum]